jgi:FKBP-type peptidyl-prolyl cis-trans isomerase 2
MRINNESITEMHFRIHWHSHFATHTEGYYAENVNLWRDLLPTPLRGALMGKEMGDQLDFELRPEQVLGKNDPARVFSVSRRQFNDTYRPQETVTPREGRFYPKGILRDVTGVFPQNIQPFRCTNVHNGNLGVDFNHPLAGKPLRVSTTVGAVRAKETERGGTSVDWIEQIAEGPGMQARWRNHPTDFFSDDPFRRSDETEDAAFYAAPLLVHHLDSKAREIIRMLYGRFLRPDMDVLDLMSSWESHLPPHPKPRRISGLGMNAEELRRNPQLTDYQVHDLNRSPSLPYQTGAFDLVICTASVEYLVNPAAVFEDIARVLKPGAHAVFTFSNRWFPPKTIRVWPELHEFERIGLVLEYFLKSGNYKNLETWSAGNSETPGRQVLSRIQNLGPRLRRLGAESLNDLQ